MIKNDMVKILVALQKAGTHIFLTDAGYLEFIRLVQEETIEERLNERAV